MAATAPRAGVGGGITQCRRMGTVPGYLRVGLRTDQAALVGRFHRIRHPAHVDRYNDVVTVDTAPFLSARPMSARLAARCREVRSLDDSPGRAPSPSLRSHAAVA